MTRAAAIGAATLALLLVAAGDGEGGGCRGTRDVEVTVVRSGPQCGGDATEPSARLLRTRAELDAAFRSEIGAEMPPVDLERDAVVLVSAGRRPTAGHAVQLASPKAAARGKVGALRVQITRPDPTALVAQVVTSPCLVVRLAREGLSEVKVLEGESLLATVTLH
jgi:hypothetical protein